MTAIELAAALIRVFEGCRLTAYQDTGGVWTIGFGYTQGVQKGQTINYEEAVQQLTTGLAPLVKLVEGKPLLAAAAYLSFGYNCGYGSLSKVLAGTKQLSDFTHDHVGNLLPGLVARRALESALIEISNA